MGAYTTTINDLVDANESKEDDLEVIKAKMADLEDKSRRNNVKISGIPESVQQQDLSNYVSQLFNTVMSNMSALDLKVDRIHWLPKPTYLSDNIPRDVILRFHFYYAKERLSSRQRDQIPAPYSNLQFYADLTQYTLQKHRNLNTITKALRNHKLSYKWGFPTKLIVTKGGTEHVMDLVAKGMALLNAWGIVPEPQTQPRQSGNYTSPDPDWWTVTHKNAYTHT